MNTTTASNINDSKAVEVAVRAPQPPGRHAVDDCVDQREEAVCIEVTPLRNCTRHFESHEELFRKP